MEEQEDRMSVEKHDLLLKTKNKSKDDEVEFLERGNILHPKTTLGGIDLVAIIQARDEVD